MRLQGATLTNPGVRNYRTGLFKTARFALSGSLILRGHDRYVVWLFQNVLSVL
jgi:hypothetical protein